MLRAFTCSWVATRPPSPPEDHVSDLTSTKAWDTNCITSSSLCNRVLFLRCLASRLTWVYWQQRIKETQEVFTLVRRGIFTGVKDLCMHLFSQGQHLLPPFLNDFLLQACLFALWPYSWCQATFPLALLQSLCPWSDSSFHVLSTYSFSLVPIKYKYFLTSFPAIAWLPPILAALYKLLKLIMSTFTVLTLSVGGVGLLSQVCVLLSLLW